MTRELFALCAAITLSVACVPRPREPRPPVPRANRIPPQALIDFCDHVAEEAHDASRAPLAPVPNDEAAAERARVAYGECLAARGY